MITQTVTFHHPCQPSPTAPVSPRAPADVAFWDENTRWYDQWLRHNRYHEPILKALRAFVRPRWRILDIGGGTGVLSRPLAAMGCSVTMLEPCRAMLRTFTSGTMPPEGRNIAVDPRRWEDIGSSEYKGWDLVIASNSLHLTTQGLDAAVQDVLNRQPRHALIVSEHSLCPTLIDALPVPYSVCLREYRTESSFSYCSNSEALEHLLFRGRWFGEEHYPKDRLRSLAARSGRLVDDDVATVLIVRFDRYDKATPDFTGKEIP
jgi:hypothetical protein